MSKAYFLLSAVIFAVIGLSAQNPATIVTPSVTPNPPNLTVDSYTRATTSIRLTSGFKYGFISGNATNLLNLNISASPNFISQYYNSNGSISGVCQSAMNMKKVVGETAGDLTVSNTGAAIYSIPIFVAPGTNGISPQLAVFYNSQSGFGELGYGFHLSGISSISRTGKIPVNDGTYSGIELSFNDYFTLEGSKLTVLTGTYGAANSTYHTEIESFTSFTAQSQQGNGPQWFEVKDKSGNIIQYGNSIDSRLKGASDQTVLSWKINKVTDEFGNYMNYKYKVLDGEIVIDKIEYTGNSSANLNPYNSVEFSYIPIAEKNSYFINGIEFKSTQLLKSILCRAEGQLARRYVFNYNWDNNRTVLTSIQEADAQGNELGPTNICWNDLNEFANYKNNQSAPIFSAVAEYADLKSAVPADLDGDGFTDFVCLYEHLAPSFTLGRVRVKVAKNNFISNYGSNNTDIVFSKIYDDDQSYFQIQDYQNGPGKILNATVIDDNLDNVQDVYTITKPRTNSSNYRIDKISVNSGVASISSVGTFTNLVASGLNPDFSPSQYFYDRADYTGDGVNDELRIDPENIILASSQGTLGFTINSASNTVARPFEFNGDGIPEYITLQQVTGSMNVAVKVFRLIKANNVLSLNQTFSITISFGQGSTNRNLLDHIVISDINGDGKSDLACLNNAINQIQVLFSDGLIFKPATGIGTNFSANIQNILGVRFKISPADLNNDGKSDLIITTDQNNSVQGTGPNYFTFYFYGGTQMIQGPNYAGNFRYTKIDFVEYTDIKKDEQGQIYSYREQQKSKNILTGVGLKADFNGDGYYDVFSINDPTTDRVITNNASGYSDNAVSTIYTGLGRRINIRYGNINNEIFLGYGSNKEEIYRSSFEYQGPGQPAQTVFNDPLYKYKLNLFCVHLITTNSGFNLQLASSKKYIYENAVLHKKGRGFLGFESIYTFDPKTMIGTKKVNDFLNSKNMPLNTQTLGYKFISSSSPVKLVATVATGSLLSSVVNTYSIVATGNTNFLRLDAVETTDYLNSNKSKTNYTYDINSAGNISSAVKSSGDWTTNTALVTETNSYTYTLNNGTYKIASGSMIKTQQGNSPATARTIDYSYDNLGRITSIVNDAGQGQNALTTAFSSPDAFGHMYVKTVSAGNINTRKTQTNYDSKGRFITVIINPLGNQKDYAYEPVYGNVISEKDITGLTTTMEYDGLGRLKKTTLPNGAINKITYAWDYPTTNYNYNGGGNNLRFGIYSILKEVETQPYVKEYYAPDLLLRTETQGLTDVVVVDNKYNHNGAEPTLPADFLLETTEPHYLNQPKYLVTKLSYEPDFFRNKREEIHLLNGSSYTNQNLYNETSYNSLSTYTTYNANAISSTDQSGKIIKKKYNEAGQLIAVTNSWSGNSQTATHNYNSLGLSSVVLTNGLNSQSITTSFVYDALGRKTDITDPSAGLIHYDYNALNEMTQRTEPNNIVWSYTYDLIGRVTSMTGPLGTTSYQYVMANAGKNLIQSVTGPNVTTEFKYNNFSQLLETKETISNKIFKTNYELDQYGRVISHTYPGGFVTKNTYNSINQLSQISDQDNNIIWQMTSQDALGDIKGYTYGNGINVTLTKNDLHYLNEKTYGNIQKQEYDYDALNGNLKMRRLTRYVPYGLPVLEEKFNYDPGDRLKKANQLDQSNPQQVLQTNNLTFDPIGNITHKDDAGDYQYNNQNKPYELSNINNPTNNISLNTLNFTYNSINKVSQISEMGTNKQMTFTYGNDNERIKVNYSIGGVNQYTRYYSENYDRQETTNAYREWTYIYAPTGLCAVHYNNNGSKQVLYALTDQLGTPLALTGSNQSVVEEYSFDSWGRRRNPVDWTYSSVPSPTILTRGFTFHEQIDEFNLINMNGRIYDPVLGRFIQPDNQIQAADNLQNFNRYAYCLNNPLKYTDPSGNVFGYDDVAVLAAGFMIGVATHLINGGQLDGQAILAGLKGAALAELGYLTMGGSVAAGDFITAQIGNAIVDNIAHMGVQIYNQNGLSLSVGFSVFSPYGFSPFASVNIAYTASMGDAYITFGASIGIGASYNQFTKEQTALAMLAGGVEAGYKDFGLGANTAYFDSKGVKGGANTTQRIGGYTIRTGDVRTQYQNDFSGFGENNVPMLSDDGDRWRTASIRVSYQDYSIGFKLATGDPGLSEHRPSEEDPETCRVTYNGAHANDYRLGALYVGYQNYQLGWNSEAIRQVIQNRVAHDMIQGTRAKWFKVLPNKATIYGNNSPYFIYSLW